MFDLVSSPRSSDLGPTPRDWEDVFDRFRSEMDKMLTSFFGAGSSLTEMETFRPPVDVGESKTEFVITAELPGLEPGDIDVSVEGEIVTIRGEKQRRAEERDENHLRRECSYGKFTRSIRLPGGTDPDRVEAKYKNGVLTLIIPKREEAIGRQITVEAA